MKPAEIGVSALEELLGSINSCRQRRLPTNCKGSFDRMGHDYNAPTYRGLVNVYQYIRENVTSSWDTNGTSSIKCLHDIKWQLANTLSEEWMAELDRAFQLAMEAVKSEELFNQFENIKIVEGLTTEEYSQIVTQYNRLIYTHATMFTKLLNDLNDILSPVLKQLRSMR